MNLVISDFDGTSKVAIPLDGTVADNLLKQVRSFSEDPICYEREVAVFVQQLSNALVDVLRKNFERPKPADVKFAIVIASALKINLPGEALEARVIMDKFLNTYAPKYHELQSAQRTRISSGR